MQTAKPGATKAVRRALDAKTECAKIIRKLKSMRNPRNVAGMARFGISSNNTLGVSLYALRDMAKTIGKSHALAQELWKTGIHEARLLAALVDEGEKVTPRQMDSWARDFDSWDVCDVVTTDLFDKTPFGWEKSFEWSKRKEEFVKRAAFSTMAGLAVHDKAEKDANFEKFLPVIEREAWDDRNFVKKAANWALRNIGKRNRALNGKAIACAGRILEQGTKPARWIASDALRELEGEKVRARLKP